MTRFLAIATICVFCAPLALAAGCGGDDDDSATAGGTTTAETAEQGSSEGTGAKPKASGGGSSGVTIATGESQFGEVLFDGDDRAIYYFDKESSDRSECYGACAEAWPPVLTEDDPRASGGADAGLLGTTKRDDGTTQATYDGHPLYYYVDDPPGEVLCHNVDEFGGLWLAVEPSGAPVP